MTQEDVIRMAREANATEIGHKPPAFHFYMNDLETFAKLVAEHEREACAKVCEEERINAVHYSAPTQSNWLAKKIRAR